MICKPCQDGALHYNERLRDQCPGGTWCDCQHQTGVFVNKQLLAQSSEKKVKNQPASVSLGTWAAVEDAQWDLAGEE